MPAIYTIVGSRLSPGSPWESDWCRPLRIHYSALHNEKMFGFYDPTDRALDSYTPPFNKKFLSFITKQRIETRQVPVDAFQKYRKTCDPNGLSYTQYLRDLPEG